MKHLICALFLLFAFPVQAVTPDEVLSDPVLETRARDISKHLRCVVCQNQSIDDSHADLAKDLRLLVRERLKAGDSDAETIKYITDRYGDFVLLKPPVKEATLLLWAGPEIFLAIGIIGVFLMLRRPRKSA